MRRPARRSGKCDGPCASSRYLCRWLPPVLIIAAAASCGSRDTPKRIVAPATGLASSGHGSPRFLHQTFSPNFNESGFGGMGIGSWSALRALAVAVAAATLAACAQPAMLADQPEPPAVASVPVAEEPDAAPPPAPQQEAA